MNAWLVVAVLVMAGCAHDTEDGDDGRAEQGRKNLAAIAALQGTRSVPTIPAEPVRDEPAAEPDSMRMVPGVVEGLPRVAPPDVQVRVPWRPSPLAPPTPENWRVTPPYTVLTPVAPAYPVPGPRCAPDYFGGQRC